MACGCWAIRTRPCSRSHEALTLAQELAHPFSLAHAPVLCAMVHQLRREGQATQERAEAADARSRPSRGLPLWGVGTILRGWALATQGQAAEGMAQMRQGLAAYQATGAEVSAVFSGPAGRSVWAEGPA